MRHLIHSNSYFTAFGWARFIGSGFVGVGFDRMK